jgi:hypothetical protein
MSLAAEFSLSPNFTMESVALSGQVDVCGMANADAAFEYDAATNMTR